MKKIRKEFLSLDRKKLTDMYLDVKIFKDAYEEKYQEFESKIKSCKEEKMVFEKDSLSK